MVDRHLKGGGGGGTAMEGVLQVFVWRGREAVKEGGGKGKREREEEVGALWRLEGELKLREKVRGEEGEGEEQRDPVMRELMREVRRIVEENL